MPIPSKNTVLIGGGDLGYNLTHGLLCVECSKWAYYIYMGKSLCAKHLDIAKGSILNNG